MNSRAKRLDRNVSSKTLCDCLEGGNVHLSSDGLLPSSDPAETKGAIAIINEKWLLCRRVAVTQALQETSLVEIFIFVCSTQLVTIRFASNVVVYCASKIRSKNIRFEDYMQPTSAQDEAKKAAAAQAIEKFLKDGMTIGLGSGTTSRWFVRILGERVAKGLRVTGVPSSKSTGELAREVGVPLADLNEVGQLDMTIDGADEIDSKGRMIKGGGANLLWEKIVATASNKMVCIVDESKLVELLGRFPLPIEVIPFGWRSTERHLRKLFQQSGLGEPKIVVRGGLATPLVTDSGHFLLDCHLEKIPAPETLANKLNLIPGVVEHGLFIGIATDAVVGHANGGAEVLSF
jgi:ribose 5-phosphate isomerase A